MFASIKFATLSQNGGHNCETLVFPRSFKFVLGYSSNKKRQKILLKAVMFHWIESLQSVSVTTVSAVSRFSFSKPFFNPLLHTETGKMFLI